MSDEKLLHVRVAEALGCKPVLTPARPAFAEYWSCSCPDQIHNADSDEGRQYWIATYDTDWSATGPLIERLHISVLDEQRSIDPRQKWQASLWPHGLANDAEERFGPTPLVAICNLILALHAAGKL